MTRPSGRSPGRGHPGRPRDPGTDDAILRAALELFVERGADGTSIEQVAKRAGVGKVTVYRRWSSKEDLLAAAIESARGDLPDPRDVELTGVFLVDFIERAPPVMAQTVSAPGFRALVAHVLGSRTSHPALMQRYWEHYVQPRRCATRALLERAKAEGILAEDADLDILIDMMVGAIMFRLLQPGPLDSATMERYIAAVYREAGLHVTGKT